MSRSIRQQKKDNTNSMNLPSQFKVTANQYNSSVTVTFQVVVLTGCSIVM